MAKKKLHEVLGSQSQVFTQADKLRGDLMVTFDKKRHLFGESQVTFQADAEGVPAVVESQSTLQTTVASELKWLSDILARAFDSEATIDVGNTEAKGSVVLDNGDTLLADLPATQLLQLDKRLGEILSLVAAIPTLDPAKGFTLDPAKGVGIYQAKPDSRKRTRKEQVPLTLVAPTKEHPGQAVVISKDVEIGTITTLEWSGLITPATKAAMLGRVEELRRAVKQARARANDIQVEEVKVGQKVLDYIFYPAYAVGS